MRLARGARAGKESLDEAGESLIPLRLLGVSATLNLSLPATTTNVIENGMRNYRGLTATATGRRVGTDQISRWSFTALLHDSPRPLV